VSAEYLATGVEGGSVEALLAEADVATRFDDLDRAEEIYDRALADGASTNPTTGAALLGLGEIAWRRGHHRDAVDFLERACRAELSSEGRTWAADRLGRSYALLGEYESSLAVLERALDATVEADDELGQLRFATLLANALLDSGNFGRAEELLARALNVADHAIDPVDVARIWWTQSRLHIQLDHPDVAARYAHKAIDLLEAAEHSGFASAAFQLLARIENDRGNGAEALSLLDRGLPAVVRSGSDYYKAMFDLERARALFLLGDTEAAGSAAMGAAGLLERVSPSDAGHGYTVLAEVFVALALPERALELYELAAEQLPENDPFRADVYTALGELLESQGREKHALEAYKAAAKARTHARHH
jgi:tetratricopeptide (TPR) repeat protein